MTDTDKKSVEMSVALQGDEFPMNVTANDDGVRIRNGDHGEIFLSHADFKQVHGVQIERELSTARMAAGLPEEKE